MDLGELSKDYTPPELPDPEVTPLSIHGNYPADAPRSAPQDNRLWNLAAWMTVIALTLFVALLLSTGGGR